MNTLGLLEQAGFGFYVALTSVHYKKEQTFKTRTNLTSLKESEFHSNYFLHVSTLLIETLLLKY